MKRSLMLSAMLAGLTACGGLAANESPEEWGQQTEALVSCSTTCQTGTLSCQGSSCSAVDGSSVQCDGVYQYCPPPPTGGACTAGSCWSMHGSRCYGGPNVWTDCCVDEQTPSNCICSYQGTWECDLPPVGG